MKVYTHTIANIRDGINKDRFVSKFKDKWFTICDGVSSKGEAGAIAAQIAVDSVKNTDLKSLVNKNSIKKWLKETGEKIKKIKGATTFTSIFLKKDKAILFHTGDSECYFIYDNFEIKEWTVPTSLAYGQYLSGFISKEDIKIIPGCSNVLVECLDGREITPQINELPLKNVNTIILCTDGVNKVSPELMVKLIFENFIDDKFIQNPAKIICEKALELQSKDDITCMVIKL